MKNLTTNIIIVVIAIFFGVATYLFATTSELILSCKACDPYKEANAGISIADKFYHSLLVTFLLVYEKSGEIFRLTSDFDVNATIGIFIFLFAFFLIVYLFTKLVNRLFS